jgi:hypothetical protein
MSQIFNVKLSECPEMAAHIAKTRALLLERETSALEARYVRLMGMGKREWRVDATVLCASLVSAAAVLLCLVQIGGAL